MANEKRLIPLQKRIIYAGDVFNSLMAEKRWSATEAADFMKDFRTVDAVEVVRCKDCKHWKLIDSLNPHMECQIFYGLHDYGYITVADDFCSYGERKEA